MTFPSSFLRIRLSAKICILHRDTEARQSDAAFYTRVTCIATMAWQAYGSLTQTPCLLLLVLPECRQTIKPCENQPSRGHDTPTRAASRYVAEALGRAQVLWGVRVWGRMLCVLQAKGRDLAAFLGRRIVGFKETLPEAWSREVASLASQS